MKVTDLVKLTNSYLPGEQLVFSRLVPFFDQVIDDINAKLNSTFPAFSDLDYNPIYPESATYDYFPDNYIRKVVALGAAYYFYVMDEEGITTAEKYEEKYNYNLFEMLRDYVELVPEEYQSESKGSVIITEDYGYTERMPVFPFCVDGWWF
jgi:hypothetical protein